MTNADAMIELCTLMLRGELTGDVFTQWVNRHYGDPRGLGAQEVDSIVQDFDRCLSRPVELTEDDAAGDGQFVMDGPN